MAFLSMAKKLISFQDPKNRQNQKSKNRPKPWFRMVKKICYTHHWIRNLIPDPMMGITLFFEAFKPRFMSSFRFLIFLKKSEN